MNIQSIQNVQNAYPQPYTDDTIYYIGHGQLESSAANNSILHVISHELEHVAEFKNEAVREGSEIKEIDVSIQYEIRNGKLVAVSGETSATTQKKEPENKDSINDSVEISNEAISALEQLKELDPVKSSSPDVQSIEDKLQQVNLELERVDREKRISRSDENNEIEIQLQEERDRLERMIELEKVIHNNKNSHSIDVVI